MQVKKFEAEDMRQALTAVKNSLGPDAIIVATRQLPRGMFQRPRLEVTAALEDPQRHSPPEERVPIDMHLEPLRREVRALRNAVREQKSDSHSEALRLELAALRTMLQALSQQRASHEPDPLVRLLLQNDVEPVLAERLVSQARAHGDRTARGEIVALQKVVAEHLPGDCDFFLQRRRVALVGPTGVGKTTTVAKIAATAALVHHKSVALITVDTYRIGATEQLRQYAQLMQVPLAVAHNETSFAAALQAHQDVDVLLVDTAGRGPQDADHLRALQAMLSQHRVTPYLVLAAATRRGELQAVLRDYGGLRPARLVFTKLDEAVAMGALLNATTSCQRAISFVTHGQRVPEDLSLPDARELAQSLISDLAAPVAERDAHAHA